MQMTLRLSCKDSSGRLSDLKNSRPSAFNYKLRRKSSSSASSSASGRQTSLFVQAKLIDIQLNADCEPLTNQLLSCARNEDLGE